MGMACFIFGLKSTVIYALLLIVVFCHKNSDEGMEHGGKKMASPGNNAFGRNVESVRL
jgi:hypothetical protein